MRGFTLKGSLKEIINILFIFGQCWCCQCCLCLMIMLRCQNSVNKVLGQGECNAFLNPLYVRLRCDCTPSPGPYVSLKVIVQCTWQLGSCTPAQATFPYERLVVTFVHLCDITWHPRSQPMATSGSYQPSSKEQWVEIPISKQSASSNWSCVS